MALKIRREECSATNTSTSPSTTPTTLNRPLQDLLNEFLAGAGAWGREGLTRRGRSILNLGMLTASQLDEHEVAEPARLVRAINTASLPPKFARKLPAAVTAIMQSAGARGGGQLDRPGPQAITELGLEVNGPAVMTAQEGSVQRQECSSSFRQVQSVPVSSVSATRAGLMARRLLGAGQGKLVVADALPATADKFVAEAGLGAEHSRRSRSARRSRCAA